NWMLSLGLAAPARNSMVPLLVMVPVGALTDRSAPAAVPGRRMTEPAPVVSPPWMTLPIVVLTSVPRLLNGALMLAPARLSVLPAMVMSPAALLTTAVSAMVGTPSGFQLAAVSQAVPVPDGPPSQVYATGTVRSSRYCRRRAARRSGAERRMGGPSRVLGRGGGTGGG